MSSDFIPYPLKDDRTLDVMYSPFRGSRDVNPHSWDSKMKFWTDAVIHHCKQKNQICFNASRLPLEFQRNGKSPSCLNSVLEEMKRRGRIQTVAEYHSTMADAQAGWLKWGFSKLVKAPVSWGWNVLVKTTSMSSNQTSGLPPDMVMVIPELVEAKAKEVLERYWGLTEEQKTGAVISYSNLKQICEDLCPEDPSFDLALTSLCSQRKCTLTQTENQEKIVKFASVDQVDLTPVSDCDIKLYKLKMTQATLKQQILQLTDDMEKCRMQAKQHLQKGLKASAKHCLRRKKKLELSLEKKQNAVEQLQSLLENVYQADTNKMVFDALAAGNELVKEYTKDIGLDKVEKLQDELAERYDEQEDVSDMLSRTYDEPSVEELEEELNSLLLDEDLPAPPTHFPEQPRQELVDLLCRRMVPDSDTSGELDLPEVPLNDPLSYPRMRSPKAGPTHSQPTMEASYLQ